MLLISSTINTGYQRVPKIRVQNRQKALIYEDFSGMNMEFDSLIPCYENRKVSKDFSVFLHILNFIFCLIVGLCILMSKYAMDITRQKYTKKRPHFHDRDLE